MNRSIISGGGKMLVLLVIMALAANRNPAFTGDSTRYLLHTDTIFLFINPYNEKECIHRMEAGQTLYSLARFYGLTVEELGYYNPGLGPSVKVGQEIRIPIPNRALIRYPGPDFDYFFHAPVYYRVVPGDTFYGLSRRLFRMPIDSIKARLTPYDEVLRPGQLVFIGYMSTGGIAESDRTERGHPLFRENRKLALQYQAKLQAGAVEKEQQGVAEWQENDAGGNHFYALHDKAPIDGFIAIENPMTKRQVYVKVVGRIPPTAYGPNVVVVVSSMAAHLLGARDPRFFVKVKYY